MSNCNIFDRTTDFHICSVCKFIVDITFYISILPFDTNFVFLLEKLNVIIITDGLIDILGRDIMTKIDQLFDKCVSLNDIFINVWEMRYLKI